MIKVNNHRSMKQTTQHLPFTPKQIIQQTTEKYIKKSSYWSGSIFEEAASLSPDSKGKWGEEILFKIIKECTDFPVQWDEDSNTSNEDGVYDLFWYRDNKKFRVEVKTSGRTISKGRPMGWQHESVYFTDNKWDALVCIDFDADDIIYFTIVNYDQIAIENKIDLSIFGKKGHCRKNEEGKAKVDFSENSLKKGIANGVTYKHDLKSPDNQLLAFFILSRLA